MERAHQLVGVGHHREALLSRGDRRLGAVINAPAQAGARFDAWEHFQPNYGVMRWPIEA